MIVAETALEAGQNISSMVLALRAALAAVPKIRRDDVMVSAPVMDVLVADVALRLTDDTDAAMGVAGAMSDIEAEEMGRFWYRVAAGEIVPSRTQQP